MTIKPTLKHWKVHPHLKMSQEFRPHSLSIPSSGCTFSIHGVFQGKLEKYCYFFKNTLLTVLTHSCRPLGFKICIYTHSHTCTIIWAWYLHPSSLLTHFQPTSNGQEAALWSRLLAAGCCRLSPEALQPGLPGSRKGFLKKICKKPTCLSEKIPQIW